MLLAIITGIAVAVAVFAGFGLYTWTAIHSGWSRAGINTFYVAALVVPPALGVVAGIAVYRLTGSRKGPRSGS